MQQVASSQFLAGPTPNVAGVLVPVTPSKRRIFCIQFHRAEYRQPELAVEAPVTVTSLGKGGQRSREGPPHHDGMAPERRAPAGADVQEGDLRH